MALLISGTAAQLSKPVQPAHTARPSPAKTKDRSFDSAFESLCLMFVATVYVGLKFGLNVQSNVDGKFDSKLELQHELTHTSAV